ncbi:MAG: small, acid-soluble spore protein, alpha/beta type [Syntrophomonadaceae bacterium]|nr:small, acid-soluble spore protein, alpha/beta type [Syntrophomonadaceae bacterium]
MVNNNNRRGVFIVLSSKKSKAKKPLTERDILKLEIAREIGVLEQVEKEGWGSISNATCGRLGGIMRQRLKQQNVQD